MNIPDITEGRAIRLFTAEFGTDLISRYKKFQEEVNELDVEFQKFINTGIMSPELRLRLIDESSDVQGTFTHFTSLIGLYQSEMLHYCIDKVIGRKTDPNYKRFGNFPVQEASKLVHDTIFPSAKHMYEVGKADNSMPINEPGSLTIAK